MKRKSYSLQVTELTPPDELKYPQPNLSPYTYHYVEWSPDGTKIASFYSRYDQGIHFILIWNVETNEIERILEGHQEQIQMIAWNYNGTLLASAEGNHFTQANPKIRLWDVESYTAVFVLDGEERITSLSWNPQRNQLATISGEKVITVWNIPEIDN